MMLQDLGLLAVIDQVVVGKGLVSMEACGVSTKRLQVSR